MATNFKQNWQMPFIRQAGVPERWEYGSFDSNIFNGNIVPTSCANMIKIGLVISEITRVTTAPFWTSRQKSAYTTEYLSNYYTDLH